MSRTLRYILTIVVIGITAMWLLTVYRSCKSNQDGTEQTLGNNTNSGITTDAAKDDLEDLYEDEEDETGGETLETENGGTTDGDTETDTTTGGETDGETSEYEDDSDVSVAGAGIDENGGEYLVVAGAFVSKSNAKKYQKQLARRSYDSEIRVFIGSDYHSVIMGEYMSRSEATKVANRLGGEAYVHKKRYPKKRR